MNGEKEASAEPCQHKHRPNAGKFGDLKGKIKPHVHAPGECKSEPDEAKTRRQLFDAVKKGDVEQVKRLLSEGSAFVNSDTVDSYGETMLHHAAFRGQIAMAVWLLQLNPSLLRQKSVDEGETPLHRACRGKQRQHLLLAEKLIKEGAPLEEQDKTGLTPLMRCCYEGNTEAVNLLLGSNASIEAKDNFGSGALHWACFRNGKREIVELLIQKGVDVNLVNQHGETALTIATEYQNEDIISILKQHAK